MVSQLAPVESRLQRFRSLGLLLLVRVGGGVANKGEVIIQSGTRMFLPVYVSREMVP